MTAPIPLSTLKRLLHRRPAGEMCRRCGAPLPAEHLHLADVDARVLDCVCAGCHAMAPAESAKSRPIPRRYLRLAETAITDEQWSALDVPVGIAFAFYNSAIQRLVVAYPGPAGATESLLPTNEWEQIVPAIAPDVEAVLVRRTHDARDCFIVPIDACYELAGRIRKTWSGFSGGQSARDTVDAFFAAIGERCEGATP